MRGNILSVTVLIRLIQWCVTQPTDTLLSVGEFAMQTDLCATSGSSTSFVSRSKVSCVNTCQSLVSKLSSCAAVNYRPKAGLCEVFNQSPLNYTFLEDDCILYERRAMSSPRRSDAGATTVLRTTSSISTSSPANLINTTITSQSTSIPLQSVFSWIVIQQRVDLTTSWAKSWSSYKSGFGTIGSNYWLGLESVHQLTSAAPYRLRIELQQQSTNKWFSVEYSTFSIGDEVNTRYTLTVAGWASDGFDTQPGDLFKASYNPDTDSDYTQYRNAGMKFTTYDQQNDNRLGNPYYTENCAQFRNGGWWFNNCYLFCLTCGSANNDYGVIVPYFYWEQTRMLTKPQ